MSNEINKYYPRTVAKHDANKCNMTTFKQIIPSTVLGHEEI